MVKFFLSVFLTLLVAVLGLPSQGLTTPVTYTAHLDGPSESPPNSSLGTGFATVIFDSTAHTLNVDVTFSGLTTGTTASHIHAPTASPGTGTAAIATTTPTFTGFPLGVMSGTYSHLFDLTLSSSFNPMFNGGTPASDEAALGAALAADEAYLNIHSTMFPMGEIRGFLVVPVPVPSPLLLFGSGLLGLVGWRRFRKG
jgi:hypothetical protein